MTASLRDQLAAALGSAFTIERELGGGGMARVFVAEEKALGRRVVIKVLEPDLAGTIDADRFRREIGFAAQLSHPHVVPLLTAGEVDGIPYYTMPFVKGRSLRERLGQAAGPLPVPEAISVIRDVLRAVAHAHRNGIVHRDLKPGRRRSTPARGSCSAPPRTWRPSRPSPTRRRTIAWTSTRAARCSSRCSMASPRSMRAPRRRSCARRCSRRPPTSRSAAPRCPAN